MQINMRCASTKEVATHLKKALHKLNHNLNLKKMRKLKRISLISGIQILDAMAQKQLRGAGHINVCNSFSTRETCSGPCTIEIDHSYYSGSCGWVGVYNTCYCAVVYLG